jgi:hypothetical protein
MEKEGVNAMSEQSMEALRKALDEIDRLRKRCVYVSRAFVFASFAFMAASFGFFLLLGQVWPGVCRNETQAAGCVVGFGATPQPCFAEQSANQRKKVAIPPRMSQFACF